MDFVWSLVVVAVLVEGLVYFAVPSVYALAALIPFGPSRRLVVHPEAAKALRASMVEAATGYRESAIGEVDLGRLELPERLEIDELVLHFDLARRVALARVAYSFSKRVYGLVRIDVVPINGAIELRPRFVLMGWPSLVVLAPVGVIALIAVARSPLGGVGLRAFEWPGSFIVGALFIGINVVLGLLFGKPRLEAGLAEVERQIQAALFHAETNAR